MKFPVLAAVAGALCLAGSASTAGAQNVTWTAKGSPVQAVITGGPWTLEQTGAANAVPSAGYCVNGVPQRNPGTERFSPYYFPSVSGVGKTLHGLFDYRPRNINEATVAAISNDGGYTWQFQQQGLELARNVCPASDATVLTTDDGYGHPFEVTIAGKNYLYLLDRAAGNIDNLGLVIQPITGDTPTQPLGNIPLDNTVSRRTVGLLNPDGILAAAQIGTATYVIYVQKILSGDTTFPAAQQCGKPAIFDETSANHDVSVARVASTTDGVNFTDLGPIQGINDPTTVSPVGTRYIGPRGTLIQYVDNTFGFFFSGGNCLDGDSDSFHYIGYAESTDLLHWTVVNSILNPIGSIAPVTITYNGQSLTLPAVPPVIGNTQGWFQGRIYSPNVTPLSKKDVILTFAGYHTPKPADDLGDYRSIGRVELHSSKAIINYTNLGENQ